MSASSSVLWIMACGAHSGEVVGLGLGGLFVGCLRAGFLVAGAPSSPQYMRLPLLGVGAEFARRVGSVLRGVRSGVVLCCPRCVRRVVGFESLDGP